MNAIARIDDTSVARLGGWTPDQVALLREQLAPGATVQELALLASYARRTGLDPFRGQVHGIVRKDRRSPRGEKMTIQVGIDGLRSLAVRTGRFEGSTPEEWCGPDRAWADVWLDDDPPAAARVGVLRVGARAPIYAVATFREYAQRYPDGNLMGLWKTHPATMLAKCAEAKALRRAFPDEMTGLYTDDEMPTIGADNVSDTDDGVRFGTVTVTVNADDTPQGDGAPADVDLAERKLDVTAQVGKLSAAEVEHLRALCRDRGFNPTPSGLLALVGSDSAGSPAPDLRAFLRDNPPVIDGGASGTDATGTEGAGKPDTPAGAPDAATGTQGASKASPVDHVAAALLALTPEERLHAADLVRYFDTTGGLRPQDPVTANDLLDLIGAADASDVKRLRAALQTFAGIRAQQEKQEADDARAADEAMAKQHDADAGVTDADAIASWAEGADQPELPF